jgi:hypothetical protein
VVLFAVTAIGGALLYPQYRIDVRPALEDTQNVAANGVFEIKEHLVAIGLGLLPVYWLFWRKPHGPETAAPRRYLTWLLAFFVWWSFIVGHVLNDIRECCHEGFQTDNLLHHVRRDLSRPPSITIWRCSGITRGQAISLAAPWDNLAVGLLWYGWLDTSALASAAIAVSQWPKNLADRLWPGWAWSIPTAVVVAMLIYERRWFV